MINCKVIELLCRTYLSYISYISLKSHYISFKVGISHEITIKSRLNPMKSPLNPMKSPLNPIKSPFSYCFQTKTGVPRDDDDFFATRGDDMVALEKEEAIATPQAWLDGLDGKPWESHGKAMGKKTW